MTGVDQDSGRQGGQDARKDFDLVVYPYDDDPDFWVGFKCKNGFVSRCVSAVADRNLPDAQRVSEILNAHFTAAHKTAKAAGE